MAIIYVPRAFGGTLILNTANFTPPLQYTNITWLTRDQFATWKTRDGKASWKTRDEQITWKTRQ